MGKSKEEISALQIEVVPLDSKDIDQLDLILREHVRDSVNHDVIESEIASIEKYMVGEPDEEGRIRKYLVAKGIDGKIYGCMAISTPSEAMKIHLNISGEHVGELLNAFVTAEVYKGGGIGRKLFEGICTLARNNGQTLLTVDSGPRYKGSWPFYDKVCDKNTGFIVARYGTNPDGTTRNANTWIKKLN